MSLFGDIDLTKLFDHDRRDDCKSRTDFRI